MSGGTLFTVGHSNRTAAEFLELLAAHGIRTLVDVRRYPGSRRHPQFGQDALAGALGGREIEYLHEADLGGRRAPGAGGRGPSAERRVPSPNGAWRVAAFRAYADYALTAPFRAALDRVLAHAAQRPTAVMCAEAVPWRCHRRIIADHTVARRWAVQHILAPHRLEPHDLHPEARVREDGGVVYPAPDGEQAELWNR